MGRQKGESARKKGNAKPSSSSRAAKVLAKDGSLTSFETFSGGLGYVPLLKTLEDDSGNTLSPEFRLVMSKLTKKDTTTKIKALSEFTDLCKTSDIGDVVNMLPFWPRIYNRLSCDNDRRVRELTQVSMCAVAKHAGKEVAPHLKSLAGWWWISQSDPYLPAAQAASNSFKEAFSSDKKQVKALNFCHQEILAVITQNVFAAKVQSSSKDNEDNINVDVLMATSLASFAAFLSNICKSPKNDDAKHLAKQLFDNARFWKLGKHKEAIVRIAFYQVLSSACETLSELVTDHLVTLCKSVLYKLDESDPSVVRSLWEAADHLTSAFPEWHAQIDLRKGFLPQFWKAIQHGFYGSGRFACCFILPIIARFPDTLSVTAVYQELFRNLQQALGCDSVRKSAVDTKAFVTAIMECMQYVLRSSIESHDKPEWDTINHVLQEQLIPMLDRSITNKDMHPFLVSPLHKLLACTLQVLSKKASDESNKRDFFETICTQIWNDIVDIGKKVILILVGNDKVDDSKKCMDDTTSKVDVNGDKVDGNSNVVDGNNDKIDDSTNTINNTTDGADGNSDETNVNNGNVHHSTNKLDDSANKVADGQECLQRLIKFLTCIKELPPMGDPGSELKTCMTKTVKFDADRLGRDKATGDCTARCHQLTKWLDSTLCRLIVEILQINGHNEFKLHFLSQICPLFATEALLSMVTSSPALDLSSEGTSITHTPLTFLTHFVMPLVRETLISANNESSVASLIHSCVILCDNGAVKVLNDIFTQSDNKNKPHVLQSGQMLIANERKPEWLNLWFSAEENALIHYLSTYAVSMKSSDHKTEEVSVLCNIVLCAMTIKETLHMNSIVACCKILIDLLEMSTAEGGYENMLINIASFIPRIVAHFQCLHYEQHLVFECFCVVLHKLIHHTCSTSSRAALEVVRGNLSFLETSWHLLCAEISDSYVLLSAPLNKCAEVINRVIVTEQPASDMIFEVTCSLVAVVMSVHSHLGCSHAIDEFVTTLMPAPSFWNQHRPSLDCASWEDLELTLSGKRIPVAGLSARACTDFGLAKTSANYVMLVRMFSEVARAIVDTYEWTYVASSTRDKVVNVMLETALADASSEGFTYWFLKDSSLRWTVLSAALRESTHGWGSGGMVVLSTLLQQLSSTEWNCNYLFDKGNLLNDYNMNNQYVNAICICIQDCSDRDFLKFVLEWVEDKAFEHDVIGSSEQLNKMALHLHLFVNVHARLKIVNAQSKIESGMHASSLEYAFESVMSWKTNTLDSFLFDCSLTDVDEGKLWFNVAVARFLEHMITIDASFLSKTMWDFVLCSLISWLDSVNMTVEETKSSPETMANCLPLLYCTCLLMRTLDEFLSLPSTIADPTLPASLISEWKEFFTPSAHASLIPIYLRMLSPNFPFKDTLTDVMFPILRSASLDTLTSAADQLEPYMVPDSALTQATQTLFHHLTKHLAPTQCALSKQHQVLAYHLILKLLPALTVVSDDADSTATVWRPPFSLVEALQLLAVDLEKTFGDLSAASSHDRRRQRRLSSNSSEDSEFAYRSDDDEESDRDDDNDQVAATSAEHRNLSRSGKLLSYLLIWKLLVRIVHHVPAEQRATYVSCLTGELDVSAALTRLFLIMPDRPRRDASNLFDLDFDGCPYPESEESLLDHVSCSVYKELLLNLPVLTRAWFNNLRKLRRAEVEEFTAKFVSPTLCRDELRLVAASKGHQDLEILTRTATREVLAAYRISDADFEICIQLPANHPLDVVKVDTIKRVGVATAQWRYWILQMTTLLQQQNGTILDALLLWKRKVDKRLDGLEECMICFSVVHGGSAQSLPKLQCKTCAKKFHAECLYKWFDTSNQSTCPLCRSPMIFR